MNSQDEPPSGKPISLPTLREWAQSEDPLLQHLAFHTAFGHPQTVPALSDEERLEICLRFLEAALSGRYGTSIPDGPYVTAHTVLGWLRRLVRSSDRADLDAVAAIVSMLERVAREAGDDARDVVVLGILEHAFEDDTLRALFDGWADDPDLAALHEEATRLAS